MPRFHGEKPPKELVPLDDMERKQRFNALMHNLTSLQRKFVAAYIDTSSIKESCRIVGISTKVPLSWEKNGVPWREIVDIATFDKVWAARRMLEEAATKASQTLIDLMEDPDANIRLRAASEVFKTVEKFNPKRVEHTGEGGGPIEIDVDVHSLLSRLIDGEQQARESEYEIIEIEGPEEEDEEDNT